MTNLFILLCMLFLIYVGYKLSKDITSPPCVLATAWTLPFLFLVLSEGFGKNSYNISFLAFYYVIGVIIFFIGYFMCNRKYNKKIEKLDIKENKKISFIFKIFILLEVAVTILFIYNVYNFVMQHFQYNFWFTYKWNVSMGNYTDSTIVIYLRTASRIITCIMFVFLLNGNITKQDKKWCYLQFIVTLVLNLIGQGRGAIFNLAIPIFIIYIMLRRKSLKDILRTCLIAVFVLVTFFIVYEKLKNPYKDPSESNMIMSIENYLCGGVVAFINWMKNDKVYYYGAYTLRFFAAILHTLGLNVNVVTMVEPYVENINGNIGNVYTFYKWYANDFGIIYALFWQFIIGMLHGYITKKLYKKKSVFALVFYALSFYPLVMQFFMDEYITMLSVWIQTFFWIFVILKTRLFYTNIERIDDNV